MQFPGLPRPLFCFSDLVLGAQEGQEMVGGQASWDMKDSSFWPEAWIGSLSPCLSHTRQLGALLPHGISASQPQVGAGSLWRVSLPGPA